ncbi:MAG: thiamine pyrophosphate-dependent enzyme [Candidatus Hermodarchaeota archaeon]
MNLSELFKDDPGKKRLLSGNEAFARGIFESGVKFAANYPGTPLSEVGDYLKYLSETSDHFTFDYSLNEKVALESCVGASWAGVRSVVMFKHLGLNVAADPLHTFPYSGVRGGMVILCGGDPGILSSTNAQDNRLYSLHTKIPIIEPATIQECKDFIKEGLRLSELFNIPIYIHVTTRLCHSYGIVEYGELENTSNVGYFQKDTKRYINTLSKALSNQKKYFEKVSQIARNKKIFYLLNISKVSKLEFNPLSNANYKIGIITSGICYSYVVQACNKLKIYPPILKLGLIFPINREEICHFANEYKLQKLLIVEELEPFIETFSKSVFCNFCDTKRDLEIHGKDYLPNIGELNTYVIMKFFSNFFLVKNKELLEDIEKKEKALKEVLPHLPIREPTFCPGCQYRPIFYTLKEVVQDLEKKKGVEFIYGGDIGCYTLGEAYPYQMIDWVISMGSGIGIANGMAHVIDPEKQKLIAFIGDSTFFHTGLQPLLNAIKNDIDLTIIIFNNYWTAMTGQQETIDTPKELITHHGVESKTDKVRIDLIEMLEGLKLENLIVTGSYDLPRLERIFTNNLLKKGTKIIVVNEECALEKKRRLRKEKDTVSKKKNSQILYQITDSCVKCNECIEFLGCPAINALYLDKKKKGAKDSNLSSEERELEYYIDEARCIPEICPGICKSVCKNYSIKKTIINPFN